MIVSDRNIYEGAPTIKGTRTTVSIILANIRDGYTFEEVSKDYGVTIEDIVDCINYAIDVIKC